MRLGIFGGTFDPVHLGHLLLAECCREQCRLDEVWFLPAAVPPHKPDSTLSDGRQRAEMLELATAGNPAFGVCRYEVDRGGVNYTYQTLAALQELAPQSELFFLVGADMFHDLPHWREPAEICRLAIPVAVARPGSEPVDYDRLSPLVAAERLAAIRDCQVNMAEVGISSTEVRQRVRQGRSIRYLVPRAVEEYIASQELYR